MRRKLEGKVAIVTGASSGLGWQIAVRLGEAGVRLCVTARRREALEALRTQLEERSVECLAVPADVTRDDEVQRVVEACLRRYGGLDLLVNDAAVQSYARFEDYRWEEIERVFDVNCFGAMRFARLVVPIFRRQGHGHVLNVASMLSVGAAPFLSAYTASKHAMLGWSEALRLELHRTGVDVSAVLVPSVSTPMFDHAPTHLGQEPRPVPPTYDTDLLARAVVKVARRPKPKAVPVFIQGTLILGLQRVAPWVGDFVLGRWGRRLQQGPREIQRPEGNLFAPSPQGIGPQGSVRPTPAWKRVAAGAALAGVALAAVRGGARLARRGAPA